MNAYILTGLRSAVTKAPKGGFRFTRPDDLAAEVIRQLLAGLPQLDPVRIDELIVGNAVPEAEQGMQMGRIISLLALPKEVPGMVVNRYCGSGLESIAIAAQRIHCGMADLVLAGGAESMSMVPVMGWKTALNYNIAQTHGDYYTSMGLTAEMVAQEFGITRDEQDAFAISSHAKAVAALENGRFKAQIAPIQVDEVYVDERMKKQKRTSIVDTDEGPRRDTSMEALAKLKPVFCPRWYGNRRQFFTDIGRSSLCPCRVRTNGPRIGCRTLGPHGFVCNPRCGAPNHGHRTGSRCSSGLEQSRLANQRPRTNRIKRSFCRPIPGRHPTIGSEPRNRQPKRWCHRLGTSPRLFGGQTQLATFA